MDLARVPTDVEQDLLERVESRGDTIKSGSCLWLRVGQVGLKVRPVVHK